MRAATYARPLRMLLAVALTALAPVVVLGLGPGASADTASGATVMKLMPLGDSITDGYRVPGGYRTVLWERTVQEDGDDIDFVGSLNGGPPELLDADHEGHSGYRIDQIRASIDTWLAKATPDVVLLHIGTNDIVQNDDMANAPARLQDLVSRICVDLPNVHLVVMSVVPRPGLDSVVNTYNAAIPGVVSAVAETGCAVSFFDMNHYLTAADMDSGLTHPTACGFIKMANALYPVVTALYDAFEAAHPSSSSPPSSDSESGSVASDSVTDSGGSGASGSGGSDSSASQTSTSTPGSTPATCPSTSPASSAPAASSSAPAASSAPAKSSSAPASSSPVVSSSAPVSSSPASVKHGLTGTYFKNTIFSGTPAITRVDATVNFTWGTGAPRSDFYVNSFGVRWTGHVVAPATTTYTFTTQADGGMRLWVNGVRLVNDWTDNGVVTHTGTIALTKGHSYAIRVEYGEKAGNASVVLRWKGAVTVPSQVVPTGDLL
ncbi:MAG TPA: PA14 domain-containing protein, partial [Actinomycetes bacterium]|nr:PA14 domain-containing protein [Actinomycetes bacterium]